jgi:dihydroxyacid dehydratase/phosphogluconate dehydratase
LRQPGVAAEEHLGKPVIAILNTWLEMNPCHMHLRERAAQVKRGVLQAGGFPVEFPVATLSETFQKPTPMMHRNLLAMETEELLRSYLAVGAVLVGGDKTTPALLRAASAGTPAIYVTAGPMLTGRYRGQAVGSGTDMWRFWDDAKAGLVGDWRAGRPHAGDAWNVLLHRHRAGRRNGRLAGVPASRRGASWTPPRSARSCPPRAWTSAANWSARGRPSR